ncbi:unnamed protein product [Caenorhabditis auriculariae]|uniref:Uncharacterized protein n=1 Tax=Caenorhabditis auriculariae TaxID=2777116 RepID=A0A8S1HIV3_9PELO|nr:unnamed protein product [Caenorhabditis auriculariae]
MIIRLLLFLLYLGASEGSEEEFRLLNDLRQGYDVVERPIANHSQPLTVRLRLILQQLVDVDEKNQVLTLVMWSQYTWNDYKMRWAPEEYGNITTLQIPTGSLWKPDIILFNSANEHFDSSFPVNFVVSHTGEVLHAPPGIIQLSCSLSMTWFPYDEQLCYLKYGSWTYTGSKLDLQIEDSGLTERHKMDLKYYVPNGEFDLLATPAQRISTDFHGDNYVELYFHMHLKRRTLYYGLNWIVPSVLISFTNILGFTMPPECGEKITLQITNLLSVTVFLGMVSEVTPPTSESIPVIAAFFSISMLILGLSIVATLVVINVHFRSPHTHRMTKWTKSIFIEWLPWMLLMSRPEYIFKKPKRNCADEESCSSEKSTKSAIRNKEERIPMAQEEEDDVINQNVKEIRMRPRLLINSDVRNAPFEESLQQIVELLQSLKA